MRTNRLFYHTMKSLGLKVSIFRAAMASLTPRTVMAVANADSSWAERWEKRSKQRAKPNQVFGWSGGDGGEVQPPAHQSLAGPWVNGKDPAS